MSKLFPQNLRALLDLVVFSWIWPLSRKAKRRPIDILDLPSPPEQVYVSSLKNCIELEGKTPWGLLFRLVMHHGVLAVVTTIGMFFRLGISFSIPMLLGLFIKQMETGGDQAIFYGSALTVVCAMQALIVSFYFSRSDRLALQIQNSICAQLFMAFFMSNREERNKFGKGTLLNIAGEDSESFAKTSSILIELVHDILTIILGIGFLYYYLGIATFTVIIPLLILASLIRSRSHAFETAEDNFLTAKDNRAGIISRFFEGIRQIKLTGLEKFANQTIKSSRTAEISLLRKYINADVMTTFIYGSVITFLPLLSFGVYAFFRNPFEANIIYPSLLLIAMLEDPFGDASYYIGELAKVEVVGKRLLGICSLKKAVSHITFSKRHRFVDVESLSVDSENQEKSVLDSLTFRVKPGESVAIVGPTGAGKTCLLHAIMGETSVKSGTVKIPENCSIGWTPQQPILFQDSIRNNISMGSSKTVDDELLKVCSLSSDISSFPGRLDTLVGNRGVTLSGGQLQRVALARVAYDDPDIILLDDPLSAVDLNTEDDLVEQLIFGVWKQKTVIMSTHRMRHLDKFDKVIFLEDGKIRVMGTFQELLENSERFSQFIKREKHLNTTLSLENSQAENPQLVQEEENDPYYEKRVENREHGRVKWVVWKSYFGEFLKTKREGFSVLSAFAFVMLTLLAGVAPLAQDAWLSIWTASYPAASSNYLFYLIYCLLGCLGFMLSLTYHWGVSRRALGVSNHLHQSVLKKLVQAKPRFFNIFPTGRIVQRLSRDVSILDRQFPKTLREFLNIVVKICLTLIAIVSSIWQTALVVPFLILAALKVGKIRNTLYRELKRLDATSRSPFYHNLDECLSDMTIIRIMRRSDFYKRSLFESFDNVQKVVYAESGLCWGFYFFSQLLVSLLVAVIMIGAIFLSKNGLLLASITGLLLKFTLDVSRQVRRAIEGWGNAESQITALERLKELESAPTEPSGSSVLPQNWPSEGIVEIWNLTARYDVSLPNALEFVSLSISSGDKVGIVGQTGAGKSSLCQLLLGVLEITEGYVKIDDVDIFTISLSELRSRVGVIPQIPFLLPGPLRFQVDPDERFEDSGIIDALEKVGLPYSLFLNGLETSAEDLDSVLSTGQKQLISFARVLLMNPSLLILDEATASVDVETDYKIQCLLNQEFKNKTVISVAHRLESVANCDYLFELSQGRVSKIELQKTEGQPQLV